MSAGQGISPTHHRGEPIPTPLRKRICGVARERQVRAGSLPVPSPNKRQGHLLIGKCDPRKCPEEINRDRRGVLPPRRALCHQVRGKDRQLVAHFRASSARSGEGRERRGKPATGWLCWQSAAKSSLSGDFPVKRKNTGNFRGIRPLNPLTLRFPIYKSAGYRQIPYAPEQGNFLR